MERQLEFMQSAAAPISMSDLVYIASCQILNKIHGIKLTIHPDANLREMLKIVRKLILVVI